MACSRALCHIFPDNTRMCLLPSNTVVLCHVVLCRVVLCCVLFCFVLFCLACADPQPLHYAAYFGQVECVQQLLGSNANPNSIDLEGVTPLHCELLFVVILLSSSSSFLLSLFLFHPSSPRSLHPRLCKPQLSAAVHCNPKGASSQGNPAIVAELLRYEAYPNFTDNSDEHNTPLDFALSGGFQECVDLLVEARGVTGSELRDYGTHRPHPLRFLCLCACAVCVSVCVSVCVCV